MNIPRTARFSHTVVQLYTTIIQFFTIKLMYTIYIFLKVGKQAPCSTKLSMKFKLLTNVIVCILTFVCKLNFMLSGDEHEKVYNLRAIEILKCDFMSLIMLFRRYFLNHFM